MAQISIIKKNGLEGNIRIDPEYYQPKYYKILDNLKKLGATPLSSVSKPTKRKFNPIPDKYFNYIEISEVDLMTGLSKPAKILGKEAPSRAQFIVKKDDIIISTVRPIRNAVSLISNTEDGYICSSGFAVLRPEKVSPEYFFVYLKTDPIIQLLNRKTTATMYPAVSENDILEIPIIVNYRLQEQITKNVVLSQGFLKESEHFYKQAEETLLEELEFKKIGLKHQLFYTSSLKESLQSNRIDAEFYQPKYDILINHIKKFQAKPLSDITTFLNHGKQPPYIDNGNIPIITQKNMGKIHLDIDSLEDPDVPYTDDNFLKQYPKYKLGKFDILFYSVGAYLGRANVYLEDNKALTTASFITIIRTKDNVCNPVYLSVLLNSPVGQLQSDKFSRASAQQYIYPKDISQFTIPLLDMKKQIKIADLVVNSYEIRNKAKELLEQAKKKVEDLIEGKAK